MTAPVVLDDAHARTPADVAAVLGRRVLGALGREAAARLTRFGPNVLEESTRPAYLSIARQFLDPLVALLVVAAAVSAAIGEPLRQRRSEAIVLLNAGLGFFEEASAPSAPSALRESVEQWATVVRNGNERLAPVLELVCGDLSSCVRARACRPTRVSSLGTFRRRIAPHG